MRAASSATRAPRLALLVTGAGALFWLQLEDAALWPPLSLGAAFAGLLTLLVVSEKLRGRRPGAGRMLVIATAGGLLAGALACPWATGLMLMKNALHAHSIPDFPAARLLEVLQLTPQMAGAGALSGLGPGLAVRLLRRAPAS